MKVDRDKLLATLEAVLPGVATKETIEQSDCFVFGDGVVRTFNEEIACTAPLKLGDVAGATVAKPLIESLRLMEDETLQVYMEAPYVIFAGQRGRKVKRKLQAKVNLPLSAIEIPETWHEISPEYNDALLMTHECAKNKDEERFFACCVHIAKGRIEATDNDTQLMRYRVKTRISKPSLIKKQSARAIAEMGARDFAETERWLHYRNDAGLVISCCRYLLDEAYPYPDTESACEVNGTPLSLPKSIGEAAALAEICSREQKDMNFVILTLSPGVVRLEGIGITGEYSHPVECEYEGEPMSFMIPPKLLRQIVEKYDAATINPSSLFVAGERFVYVSRLRDPEVLKKKKRKKQESEE